MRSIVNEQSCPECLCSDILLLLLNQVQHLPLLLKVAQRRSQLSTAHMCLCCFMATTTPHLPAVNKFSTSVRFWYVEGSFSPLSGFLAGFFRPVPQASNLELPSLSLCACRGVGLDIASPVRAKTTVRCCSHAGLSVVSVSLGFNSPQYCLWWSGKILRYQLATPLPASPGALRALEMHLPALMQ